MCSGVREIRFRVHDCEMLERRGFHLHAASCAAAPGACRRDARICPSGVWDIAKGRFVPCFRTATAVPVSVRSRFFLSEDMFPNFMEADTDVFRTVVFLSRERDGPLRVEKVLVSGSPYYQDGHGPRLSTLEAKLRASGAQTGSSYRFLDVAGRHF